MKHIHFIGICGVAMSAIAMAFQKNGWIVTGSDVGFFPPISTNLKNNKINFYPGWHPEKMTADSVPDLVVVGNVASSTNPEWQYVQKNNIPHLSYPEVLAKYFIKKNSIVCAGTYGKTSTSALLSFILTEAGYDPSYMFGALAVGSFPSANQSLKAAVNNEESWSVMEGDEYKSARWDLRPKFAHYSPTHLLLTGLQWDHADIYPTEEKYFQEFKSLVGKIPEHGILVASGDEEKVQEMLDFCNCRILTYGKSDGNMYKISNITQNKNGLSFYIEHNEETFKINSHMLGEFQARNITGCFAMAHFVGIPENQILKAINKFPGIKRRLEKRLDKKITVFDDIAHSPAKAKSTLKTLRGIYDKKIIAIFEPNTGNRKSAAIPGYDLAFTDADMVIIPELSKIKVNANDADKPFDGKQLAEIIGKTHDNVKFISEDEKIIDFLTSTAKKDDCIVFLGSHGFRGMIDEFCKQLF